MLENCGPCGKNYSEEKAYTYSSNCKAVESCPQEASGHSVTDTYDGCCCRLLEEHREQPEELNINCVDPLNRSALITAIENENIELIRILLEWNIDVKVHVVTIRMWDS
jgi:ankyrin repeat protein